ncbi:ABC transporter substrate-binding protein [Clostridium sediminicola]|uniref:ABC transporter substrate-binding protein n=1 Tax=Clostridium sediminicola TaxID=3114879 RepID=UPI0031F266EF
MKKECTKKMKKVFLLLFVSVISLSVLIACSTDGKTNEQVNDSKSKSEIINLEFAVKETGSTLEAYETIVSKFNSENDDVNIEVVSYGKDYGSLLKAKMASNDLPDLWTTHGWAVFLYGEYLLPLNEQPWTDDLIPEIKPTMTDLDGNIVALPLDIDISGMIYNKTILNELSIEIPKNQEEFIAACAKIKEAGYTPVHIAGKDASDVAGLVSRVSLSTLTTSKTNNYADQLYDGTFDWSNYNKVSDFILSLVKNGYTNVDYLTADKSGTFNGFAQNKVAFAFQSNGTLAEVSKINPNADVAMMKIPGYTSGDEPFLISGERDAVGVWKDTEYKEEALKFLKYLAKPENVLAVSEAYSLPPSMKGVKSDVESINNLLNQLEGTKVTNHFDREYLPNGMWSTLKAFGPGVLSDELTPEEGSELMEKEYNRLREVNN